MIAKVKKIWKSLFGTGEKSSFLPNRIYSDDVFVVSYPKSGNTWVRFLLANALYPERNVDFHSIHELIPEVCEEDNRRPELPKPRILKSHAPYRSAYPRVIYVLRDGRDVYASYYHYRKSNLEDEVDFAQYIDREDHWPGRWGDHALKWVRESRASDDILVVRYEELKRDSAQVLSQMLSFVGYDEVEDSRIHEAAQASSFSNMRTLEEEKGRRFSSDGASKFVRKGKSGGWKGEFTPEAKEKFIQREGEALIELGYETDTDW